MTGQENAETRVEEFTRDVDLGAIARALAERRDEILTRWTKAAIRQPFHEESAEPPNIESMFDGLVHLLVAAAPRSVDPPPPLNDPVLAHATRAHVQRRLEDGLRADEVAIEFRLLRQEIGRALRFQVGEATPTSDIIGAMLLIDDAIDGAISVALSSLDSYIEEMRAEVLGSAVHDLRQPLTAMRSSLGVAAKALGQPNKNLDLSAKAVRLAEAGTERLAMLVATLADASRVASGRVEVKGSQANLAQIVHAATDELGPAVARRVRLQVSVGLNVTGFWDPAHLTRVVMNLLSNAAKFSPEDAPIDVALESRGDSLLVRVHDAGIGLTAEEISLLFRRFARSQRVASRRKEGLGLGLYLSRGLVEAHGGRIWAQSAGLGKGTTFSIELPRHREAA
ncbi:MAG TPA: ATP-binding protein [Chloroflexota bacterium]